MKKSKFTLSAVLIWIFLISAGAAAEELNLASTEWRPYAGEELLNHGFTSEIIEKALAKVGYSVRFVFLPWKRAMEETVQGRRDALYSAYYSKERDINYAISESYAESRIVLCARKDSPIGYQNLRDLIPYKIGVVKGYVNSEEFDNADYLNKDYAVSDLINLKKLLARRIDLVVIDRFVAIYLLKNHSSIEGDLGSVRFLDPPLGTKTIHVMFSKAKPNFTRRVSDFNRGLTMIKEDGTYKAVLEKHGFSEP